jgi:hypothetical protein
MAAIGGALRKKGKFIFRSLSLKTRLHWRGIRSHLVAQAGVDFLEMSRILPRNPVFFELFFSQRSCFYGVRGQRARG